LVVTVPSSLFYLIIGYYFGAAYDNIMHYVKYSEYFLVLFLIIFAVIFYVSRKISRKISGKIEKI